MRPSSVWLCCGASLLVGLVLGWELVGGRGAGAPVPGAAGAHGGGAGLEDAAGVEGVPAPVPFVEARGPDRRRVPAAQRAGKTQDSEPPDPHAVLLAELRAACAAGTLTPGELSFSIVRALLRDGRCGEVLALLGRVEPQEAWVYASTALALGRGCRAPALEVLELGLERLGEPSGLLSAWLRLDAERGLALLRAFPASRDELERSGELLAALFDTGRRGEALVEARRRVAEGLADDATLRLLVELAPAEAEVELERLRGAPELEGQLWPILRRAQALAQLGRDEEGFALLDAERGRGRAPERFLWEIVELFPRRAFELLESLDDPPDGEGLWCQVGLGLQERGDQARADEAFLRAYARDPADFEGELLGALFGRRRGAVLAALEAATLRDPARVGDAWGELGRVLWEGGERSDALAAWERAHALAPADGWDELLAAVHQGRDPLADW